MGLVGIVALVVIFIGFPLLVYASFRVVLAADRGEQDERDERDGSARESDHRSDSRR